jgi:hypothetical protein
MEAPAVQVSTATVRRETLLINGAVALVAQGDIPRVTLVGLHGGPEMVSQAARNSADAGVALRSKQTGPMTYDLVVERDG